MPRPCTRNILHSQDTYISVLSIASIIFEASSAVFVSTGQMLNNISEHETGITIFDCCTNRPFMISRFLSVLCNQNVWMYLFAISKRFLCHSIFPEQPQKAWSYNNMLCVCSNLICLEEKENFLQKQFANKKHSFRWRERERQSWACWRSIHEKCIEKRDVKRRKPFASCWTVTSLLLHFYSFVPLSFTRATDDVNTLQKDTIQFTPHSIALFLPSAIPSNQQMFTNQLFCCNLYLLLFLI